MLSSESRDFCALRTSDRRHRLSPCSFLLQALVEEMSALMKCVALHNAPLLHQHSCRRMDSGALNARDQLPPAGFYAKILVCTWWLKARFLLIVAVQISLAKKSQQVKNLCRRHAGLQNVCCSAVLWKLSQTLRWRVRTLCSLPCSPLSVHGSVQDLLGLSGEQREQLLAHRHIKLVSLARLVQERRELQLKLQVSLQRQRTPSSDVQSCCHTSLCCR